MTLVQQTVATPLGPWRACWQQQTQAILALLPESDYPRRLPKEAQAAPLAEHPQLLLALDQYFTLGDDQGLRALLICPQGSAFQQSVWQGLRRLRFGESCHYQQLAQRIDRPKAVRALGNACGANPLPLIVPCHRVLAKDPRARLNFSLNPSLKEWLLAHENIS